MAGRPGRLADEPVGVLIQGAIPRKSVPCTTTLGRTALLAGETQCEAVAVPTTRIGIEMTEQENQETARIEGRLVNMWEPELGRPLCGSRDRIVVGVRDTPASRAALKWAGQEARIRKTHLHVVNFVEPGEQFHKGFLRDFIHDTFEPDGVPVDIESATIPGKIPESLAAGSHNAALLVLGAPTREDRYWDLIYRSVPKRVASFSTAPLVIVREGQEKPAQQHNRVIAAVDESFTARDALLWAAEEAVSRGSSPWLTPPARCELSVLWQTPRMGKWVATREKVEELLTQEISDKLWELNVSVEDPTRPFKLGSGTSALTLTEASRVADLVVIGAASKSIYDNLESSIERESEESIECPVVIVPESGDDQDRRLATALANLERTWARGVDVDVWFTANHLPSTAPRSSGADVGHKSEK